MPLNKLDTITVWPREEGTNMFGEIQYGDPYEVDCRWDDISKRMEDDAGFEFVSKSSIYNDILGQIEVGYRVANVRLVDADIKDSFIIRSSRIDRNGSGTRLLHTSFTSISAG